MDEGSGVDGLRITLLVLTGLTVFLYAVDRLSEALRGLASDRLEQVLHRWTRHLLSAVAIGTLVTVLLDSSSAVIILTIVLVNSGAMRSRNALGVVLGANIGTTFSSQVIAFDIGEWSAAPMALGLVLMHAGRSPRWKGIGEAVFCFGLLFAGLFMMGHAVTPLKGHPSFATWMEGLEHPVRGALIGGLVTLVVQSSSATVAMAITLAKQGALTLAAGIAVMLGAELGTCSDTLLATVRCRRPALRVGLFHLGFNLVTIVLSLLMMDPFTRLVVRLSAGSDVARSIANAHMLFNVLGVLLVLPFVPAIARAMEVWLPARSSAARRVQLDPVG